MNLARFALRNIAGSPFRSWVVALCALLVAAFALSTTLVMRGAEASLRLALSRLGADIIVVPDGTQTKVEGALLMGTPTSVWMPAANVDRIAAVPGVAAATPQLYLSTLHGASCCSMPDMFLVAFDPRSDFVIQPWLEREQGSGLRLGEAVGGTYVFIPPGEQNIRIYGYLVTLKANLEPTGTGLDQSLFLTFDTARDVARLSRTQADQPLEIPGDSVSAVLVRLAPGSESREVAVRILQQVPGVTPIQSPELFLSYRKQMAGLLSAVLALLGVTWALSLALIALVFAMAANERHRELGVLRALGATRSFVMRSLLAEALLLAFIGGSAGIALALLVLSQFRKLIMVALGLPFLFPDAVTLAGYIAGGLIIALLSAALAAGLPAYRVSRQDPAVAMRE